LYNLFDTGNNIKYFYTKFCLCVIHIYLEKVMKYRFQITSGLLVFTVKKLFRLKFDPNRGQGLSGYRNLDLWKLSIDSNGTKSKFYHVFLKCTEISGNINRYPFIISSQFSNFGQEITKIVICTCINRNKI